MNNQSKPHPLVDSLVNLPALSTTEMTRNPPSQLSPAVIDIILFEIGQKF